MNLFEGYQKRAFWDEAGMESGMDFDREALEYQARTAALIKRGGGDRRRIGRRGRQPRGRRRRRRG